MAVFGNDFLDHAAIVSSESDGFWADFSNSQDVTLTELLDAWSDFVRPISIIAASQASFPLPDADVVATAVRGASVTVNLLGIVDSGNPAIGDDSFLRALTSIETPVPESFLSDFVANAGDFAFDFDNGEVDPADDGFVMPEGDAGSADYAVVAWSGGWDDLSDGYDTPQGDDNFF